MVAATGATEKNTTKRPQNTSAGKYAPVVYEKPSQEAMTTNVAAAPAACSSARRRATATTNRPISTSKRKPKSSHGRLPYAGTVLRYTATRSGIAAALSAVYSNATSLLSDFVESSRP